MAGYHYLSWSATFAQLTIQAVYSTMPRANTTVSQQRPGSLYPITQLATAIKA